jgi:hypothetical protein
LYSFVSFKRIEFNFCHVSITPRLIVRFYFLKSKTTFYFAASRSLGVAKPYQGHVGYGAERGQSLGCLGQASSASSAEHRIFGKNCVICLRLQFSVLLSVIIFRVIRFKNRSRRNESSFEAPKMMILCLRLSARILSVFLRE